MVLSDYCTINREGNVFIDIDSGWKFHCNLHGMRSDYAQIFIRRLSKKRRLYEEDELLAAEVTVPNIHQQVIILGAVNTVFEMWMTAAALSSEYDKMRQKTGDDFYSNARMYLTELFGELIDYYYMLIDQLMGV